MLTRKQLSGFARLFIASQFWLSKEFDRLLPECFRIDGHQSFRNEVVLSHIRRGMCVYDVGGGKHPQIGAAHKLALELRVIGLGVDSSELAQAPSGCYDDTICCDIAEYRGRADADLVICQATLEHVRDNTRAMAGIASAVRPGGIAAIFAPNRYAAYARLNSMLPLALTRRVLDFVFPRGKGSHGFQPHYDKCTVRELGALGRQNALKVIEVYHYYCSSYFGVFFPAYLVWRLLSLVNYAIDRERAAETFTIIFRKPLNVGDQDLPALNLSLDEVAGSRV
jgi:SAM-dependent methyltransferase